MRSVALISPLDLPSASAAWSWLHFFFADEPLKPARLFDGSQIDALQILEQRGNVRIPIMFDRQDRFPAIKLGCPPAPLAGDDNPFAP
jgi:hypothetical protein